MKNKLLLSLIIVLLFYSTSKSETIEDFKNKMSNLLLSIENSDASCLVNNLSLNEGKGSGDITFGPEYIFKNGQSDYIDIAAMDDSHFVVAYANGNAAYCIVGTISGSNISYGFENYFVNGTISNIKVAKLATDTFAVTYKRFTIGGDNTPSYAIIGSYDKSFCYPTYGSACAINFNDPINNSIAVLDANHFVVAYSETVMPSIYAFGKAIVCSRTNRTISIGSEYMFNSSIVDNISISAINSTSFIVGYRDGSNSNNGYAVIGAISGTTISYGSAYQFNGANTDCISVSTINSSSFIIAYKDIGNSNYGTAINGSISGSTINFGSEIEFNTANTSNIATTSIDDSHFVIAYSDDGNSGYGTIITGIIGTGITFASESVYNSASTSFCSISALGNTGNAKFVCAYSDLGNATFGTAVVGTIEDVDSQVLPIDWLNFYYSFTDDKKVELKWSTASENNNFIFEIQQSEDAVNFNTIGKVYGVGYSNLINEYGFIVDEIAGLKYYRLKQVDFDGKFEYSNTIAVKRDKYTEMQIDIFPNPVQNMLIINFNQIPETEFEITIINSDGQIVLHEIMNPMSSIHTVNMKKNLSHGIYYVKLESDNQLFSRKIIKN